MLFFRRHAQIDDTLQFGDEAAARAVWQCQSRLDATHHLVRFKRKLHFKPWA